MFSRSTKTGIFILEGFNAFATTYFFYYAYFLTRERFGFTTQQNLLLASGMGFVYMFAAIFCGRFARKRGYFLSLKIGFAILGAVIAIGSFATVPSVLVAVIAVGNIGMCFTWPALQSIISSGETSQRLQRLAGLYNFTWASCSAFAYFIGGTMIKKLGIQSMFYLPVALHLFQLAMLFWLEKRNAPFAAIKDKEETDTAPKTPHVPPNASNLPPKTFLKMAWLANPFAYVAVNTIVATMPTIAGRLQLSLNEAGFCCSVWFIIRAIFFVILRAWPNWHYRFDLLLAAYLGMVAGFTGILLAPAVWILVSFEIVFGIALSLIYYSSLFYSLDADETKGDNAGFHEGMIGLGTGGGPAVGAAALHFFPQVQNANVIAITGLLICGLAGLLWLRAKGSAARGIQT